MPDIAHTEQPTRLSVDRLLDQSVQVNGVTIRYGASGHGDRDLILVHGHLAHHMWWHAVVPVLEAQWRVIQLDLSGHGDSGHRSRYDIIQWADEVAAVLDAAGSTAAVLVAHSLGGSVAIAAAARQPERISGLILIDTYVVGPGIDRPQIRGGPSPVYPTQQEGLSRFRLIPLQPELSAELLSPIAEYSLRRTEGGWRWKFDRAAPLAIDDDLIAECIEMLDAPACFIYGKRSEVVSPEVIKHVRKVFPVGTQLVGIADGYHHLVLDSADECARIVEEYARMMIDVEFASDPSALATDGT